MVRLPLHPFATHPSSWVVSMELSGHSQIWAQSHESATPKDGGHAVTSSSQSDRARTVSRGVFEASDLSVT